MEKQFEERLMTMESDQGKQARNSILDRFEAWEEKKQHDEYIEAEYMKAFKNADADRVIEILASEYNGKLPEEVKNMVYEEMEEVKKLNDKLAKQEAIIHERERQLFLQEKR